MAPKITNCNTNIIKTAAYIAVYILNEGTTSLLKIMNIMEIRTGRNAA